MSEVTTDYDSAWKQTLKVFFPDFMAFFFPDAHADIEWAKGYQFLDKELQQAASDAELGRRRRRRKPSTTRSSAKPGSYGSPGDCTGWVTTGNG